MIKIIVDSTAYLTKETIKDNDITVLPLTVLLNEKIYDEADFGKYPLFFEALKSSKEMPTTSQPSVLNIESAFKKVLEKNDEAIVLTLSSTLSGTYNTCVSIKNSIDKDDQISVVDSGTISQNVNYLVFEILKMIQQNKTRKEIVDEIETIKEKCFITFLPDTLTYLKKGGRIGTVKAIIGSVLQVKPVLHFNNGSLTCPKNIMGTERAIKELIKMLPEKFKKLTAIRISKSPFYEKLLNQLKDKYGKEKIEEGELGPVIGSHIGPAIGVAYVV